MLWPHIHTLVAIWRAGIEEDQDMKHLRLLPALAVMLLAVPALADAIPATLKLDEVIVNPRGAQLVRVGDVKCLPAFTKSSSIRCPPMCRQPRFRLKASLQVRQPSAR